MITPIGNRALIVPDEADTQTKGGIYLPDNAIEEKTQGKVVASGEDCRFIKPGHKVIFTKYAGDDLTIDGKKHKILKEDEVIAFYD